MNFPTWLTGPNGERRVFHKAEDVPEGWVDGLTARDRVRPEVVREIVDAELARAMDQLANGPALRRNARRK